MKKNKPFQITLIGCPTERSLKGLYYPKLDSVKLGSELIPLNLLNQFGQTAIKTAK